MNNIQWHGTGHVTFNTGSTGRTYETDYERMQRIAW